MEAGDEVPAVEEGAHQHDGVEEVEGRHWEEVRMGMAETQNFLPLNKQQNHWITTSVLE